MMRNARPRRRGFTLIEILSATLIFSIMMGAAYAIFFSALRLRESTFRAVETGLPRQQVADVVRQDFAGAVVPNGVLSATFTGTAAGSGLGQDAGEDDTVTFSSTTGAVSDGRPWGDIQQVVYALVEPEDRDSDLGKDLIRTTTRNLLATIVDEDDPASSGVSEWRLLRGVAGVEILYWDAETEDWTDSWDSSAVENANPKAVMVRIEFVQPEGAERIDKPLEIFCAIAAQPRPTPAT